jgi:hypothetical protein
MESSSLGRPETSEPASTPEGSTTTDRPKTSPSGQTTSGATTPTADRPPTSRPGPGLTITVRQAGRRVLRRGKYLIGDDPVFLPILLRATPEGTSRAITDRTRLVIEGFPRSGNTFAVFAFRNAQGPGVEVVGHVHHPSQVKLAVRRGLPTLLVIRRPLPCLASYLVTAPHGRPTGVLKEYIRFHRELIPYLDDIVVGEFDQVTKSFSDVITTINERFGTTFAPFDQSEDNVDQVFKEIEAYHAETHPRKEVERVVPRPSHERDDENRRYLADLQSPAICGLLHQADQLYQRFVEHGSPAV